MSFLTKSRTLPHPVLHQEPAEPSPIKQVVAKLIEIGESPSADLMPPVSLTPTNQTKGVPMSVTGAAPVTLSIKQMIEQSRQIVKAAHEKLQTNAAKVATAAGALDSLGDDLGKEGDDLLAMVGQYKNDLGSGS